MLGVGYAILQYSKSAPWSKRLNYALAVIRTALITLICLLLLEPYLKSIENYFQKPLMLIAVDNSASIELNASSAEILKLKAGIKSVKSDLIDQGFDVNIIDLDGSEIESTDSLKFLHSTTDLSKQLIKAKTEYANFNLSGIILFTDGIFNAGYTPSAISFSYPIYTIGLGDTSEIKDISIAEIKHNSTVFEGNSLLLEVHTFSTGVTNISTEITVWQKGKIIARNTIQLSENQSLTKTIFTIPIIGSGKQSLTINLQPIEGEFTELNNKQSVYFDVINAQKKILIIASAPHPDLKAIKSSIEQSEYYKVDLAYELPEELVYDLIITHQYPTTKTSARDKDLLLSAGIPLWMVIGNSNDFGYLQNKLNLLTSNRFTGKTDLVRPVYNPNFDKFRLEDDFLEWISDIPPLATPYGLTINNSSVDEFLYQQIGNVLTKQPLLFFTQNQEARLGVLLGTNSWKWKLDEYRTNGTHVNFDGLISKTIQYLSSNTNKKRFYVYPKKNLFEKGEDVLFLTEEYNALFERIVGEKVTLDLTHESGSKTTQTYVPLSENSVYKLSELAEGVYNYEASTKLDGKNYFSTGQFVVQQLNKEALNPVADFSLLKKMANSSNGSFYELAQIEQLKSAISDFDPISTIHSNEKEEPILSVTWIFSLLVLIAAMEWFLRKFFGGY